MLLSKGLLFKSFIYQIAYLLAIFLKIGSIVRRLHHIRFAFIIPFKYIFLCRFGDNRMGISAFTRRYYNIIKMPKDGVVLDIGSRIETFAVRCAKKLKKGIVVSIVSKHGNLNILLRNIFNEVQNIAFSHSPW